MPHPRSRRHPSIGNRFCFYIKPHDSPIQPPQVRVNPEKGSVPQELWSYGILEDEGQQKFQDIVTEVKQACTAL